MAMFGWMSYHHSKGDKKFGFMGETVKFMYTFPDLFSQSVEEVKTLPKTFIKTPADFKPVNKLEMDVPVLSVYSDTNNTRKVVVRNLKNDSILYSWRVKNPYNNQNRDVYRIMHPLLLPGKTLICGFEGNRGVYRIDSLSNIVWKQDSIKPHHSMNLDKNGDAWICSFQPVYHATGYYRLDGKSKFFIDNYITKLDVETGHILFHKSVVEILTENNLQNYILKSGDSDPIHINDIEPAFKTTEYYREGDLFISCRKPSLVFQYRPSGNKVIRLIEGPFVSQHDVDFLDDENLVFFNNNYYPVPNKPSMGAPRDSSYLADAGDLYSNIVKYNFADQSIGFIGDSLFRENKIFSMTEGLIHFFDHDTYFVEEQNTGELWIIRNNEVIYKNVFNSQHEGYHHLPNWTRILTDYE